MANLAQLYLREVLRTQCWDEMKVKGKVLKVCRTDHAPSAMHMYVCNPHRVLTLLSVASVGSVLMVLRVVVVMASCWLA